MPIRLECFETLGYCRKDIMKESEAIQSSMKAIVLNIFLSLMKRVLLLRQEIRFKIERGGVSAVVQGDISAISTVFVEKFS